MFTGIIEETGSVRGIRRHSLSASLTIACEKIIADLHIGDSIAVNGICLTVTSFDKESFTVDVMPETMTRTSLRALNNGSRVNLERAMAANGRFGGHFVSGHIDGTGTLTEMRADEIAVVCRVEAERELLGGVIPKGSVTLDGISLTVVDVDEKGFTVSLIPHTRAVTNLRDKKIGDPINVETDMIGKYVKKYLTASPPESPAENGVSLDFMEEKGFL